MVRGVTSLVTAKGVALLPAGGVALAATFDGTPGSDDIRGRGGADNLSGAGGIDRVRGDGGI